MSKFLCYLSCGAYVIVSLIAVVHGDTSKATTYLTASGVMLLLAERRGA